MKKVFCLRKNVRITDKMNADPSFYLGKEYIFDEFYTIKPISISRDAFVVSLEIDTISQISRIAITDFINHVRKGNMVEKTSLVISSFVDYDEYYVMATSFLLINYNIMIDSIVFDWEEEFRKETPIEVACKIALGIIKK